MEDTILINSNVAYHTCRNDVQHQHINWSKDCSKESVPTAVDSRAMHKAANQHLSKDDRTRNHRSLNELEIDNLKVALVKMKKLLVCVILICASLVMTTLTVITLSTLSYRLGQMNDEHQIRLDEVNGTLCNTIPQDILQLDEYIQKKFASLQTQLYCGAGQWHCIAFLNMSDPTQQCPSAWREYNTSGVRACGRTYSTEGSCSSVTYTAENLVYSRVCGQLVGYQVGSPDAFSKQLRNPYIDINGVNITQLGTPHYHIWSFAGGLSEDSSLHRESNCPCSFTSGRHGSPSYIGSNYYCESGNPTDRYDHNQIFPNDPVWDGQKCEGTCCIGANNPPWFSVQLPVPTTEMIEVRICADESTDNEDTPIELLEIYVQ